MDDVFLWNFGLSGCRLDWYVYIVDSSRLYARLQVALFVLVLLHSS